MEQCSIVGRVQDWVTYHMFELVQPLPQLFLLKSEVQSCAWCQVIIYLEFLPTDLEMHTHGKLLKLAAAMHQVSRFVNLWGRVLLLAGLLPGFLSAVAGLPWGTSCALSKFLLMQWLSQSRNSNSLIGTCILPPLRQNIFVSFEVLHVHTIFQALSRHGV